MDFIIQYIAQTFGISFLSQYAAGKCLDKVGDMLGKKDRKDEWSLFERSVMLMCEEKGWEYDAEHVRNVLSKMSFSAERLDDNIYLSECLCELLGQDYGQFYGSDLITEWQGYIFRCLKQEEFKPFIASYVLSLYQKMEDIIKQLQNVGTVQDKLQFEVEQLRRESEPRREQVFQDALQQMEDEEWEKALESLKKVCIWTEQEREKYLCFFYSGFCLVKRNEYSKAIKSFKKAEKICDVQRDDCTLLYRNMALTYIHIGEREDKVANYKRSNQYFEKVIQLGDNEYMTDAYIHIARNEMGMSEEVPIEESQACLDNALFLLLSVGWSVDKMPEMQAYVFYDNLAHTLKRKVQTKGDYHLLDFVIQIYDLILQIPYVREKPEELAKAYRDIGSTYYMKWLNPDDQMKSGQKEDYIAKAKANFDLALKVYDSLGDSYKEEREQTEFDKAALLVSIFHNSMEEEDFRCAEACLNSLERQRSFSLRNPGTCHVYLKSAELYFIDALNHPSHRTSLEKARQYAEYLESITKQNAEDRNTIASQLMIYNVRFLELRDNQVQSAKAKSSEAQRYIEEIELIMTKLKDLDDVLCEMEMELIERYEQFILET